ncbi:MAG TPA: dethiobiotin synthase [Gammaproteobacteria bacterium]|nr:dethiobiotin synthase [Gammaproteobacteria bacterium]
MKNGLFITGTSTDIGKTLVAALLLSAAHSQNLPAYYFKPVQTGQDSDCATVSCLTGLQEPIIKPVFSYASPQAPYRAALAEQKPIQLDHILAHWQQLTSGYYLVEGAGGLLVPLTQNHTIRDLAFALKLPLIIVASTQLGTMNHTLLTLEAAANAKVPVKGLILSGSKDPELATALQPFISVPILAAIPDLTTAQKQNFQQTAKQIFPFQLLQKILI